MVDEYTTDASPCPEQQAKTKEKTFPQSKSEPDSCEQGSSSADHKETNPEDNPFDFNSLPRDPNAKGEYPRCGTLIWDQLVFLLCIII